MTKIAGVPLSIIFLAGIAILFYVGLDYLLACLGSFGILFFISVVHNQEELFYQNSDGCALSRKSPKETCKRSERVQLTTNDNVELHAWFFPVEDRWTLKTNELTLKFEKKNSKLGVDLGYLNDGAGVEVKKVHDEGLIPEWNQAHDAALLRVAAGDVVLEVNGIRGDAKKQLQEFTAGKDVEFILQRVYEDARPTVLFLLGNDCSLNLNVPLFVRMTDELGVNVVALDYRGYGMSNKGTPSEECIIEDCLCAWRWIRERADAGKLDGSKVFVSGVQLGGSAAVALAAEIQREGGAMPQGLILEDTLISADAYIDALIPSVIRLVIGFALKAVKEAYLRLSWDTTPRIRDLKVPMLFVSGGRYKRIPRWFTEHLCRSALKSPFKRHVHISEHGTTLKEQFQFIEECMAGPRRTKDDAQKKEVPALG